MSEAFEDQILHELFGSSVMLAKLQDDFFGMGDDSIEMNVYIL